MKTLAELNANQQTREWGGYTLQPFVAVGANGFMRSGTKAHLIFGERVLADATPGGRRYRVGATLSAYSPCNGNGQHVSQVIAHADTDKVSCAKCLRHLEAAR